MKLKCGCGAVYQVRPELAGKKLKCRKCQTVFLVPESQGSKAGRPKPAPAQGGHWAPLNRSQTTTKPEVKTRPKKKSSSTKADREAALLAQYSGNGQKTLDERMAERQRETMEDNRLTNCVKHALIGLGCFIAAVAVFFILESLENGGVAPRIVWLFVWTGGKWWIPPALVMAGAYNSLLAYWFMVRSSNTERSSQEK